MSRCKFNGSDQPRVVEDQHLRDCNASGCPGCKPCTERHCTAPGCPGRHLDPSEHLTCAKCVGYVRENLAEIERLCCDGPLDSEAEHRGVNSQAAMLAGPAANPEAWGYRALSAIRGRVPAEYLEDCRDELHPLWVLGTWEIAWRQELDHDTDRAITIGLAVDYLRTQLTYMAQRDEPDFGQFASEVRQCRSHLEDVLGDSRKPETGAPCPMCGKGTLVLTHADRQASRCDCGPRPIMRHADHGPCTCAFRVRMEQLKPDEDPVPVRVYDEPPPEGHVHPREDLACVACRREAEWDERHSAHADDDPEGDRWVCPRCDASYSEHDYRTKVDAIYTLHAGALTASQIRDAYRVPEGTIRQWANRGKVRKRGTDRQGRMLYDVADTLAMRDGNARDSA